ncbi:response regulator transcription factor [Clostridium sp. D2Q-11]|uniref:Response regulator transcription factor n=1 Tax=Anaeromonas frigoriresistens TaxID=2683708 RepID=A0A942UPZ4_9FIRM|nr:response regulator transcription factor [Anaeromonas frigoriresistens]MBS4537149.1 response regulator transcription factor [Anaeromonas frigoriresistens]
MASNILIVDDEALLVKGLKYSLEQDSYDIDTAYDGREALNKAKSNEYDLIILDLMLPEMDGLEVCQKIRETSQVPIIMLTAKGEDMNKILGLEYGADDYLTKPFNILELKARIKAILRRSISKESKIGDQVIHVEEFTINTLGRKVSIGDKDVNLTAKEFDLLLLLATNPGKVFTREELLEIIWGYEYFGDLRTVDVHIRRLREKIEKNSSQAEYILTKWGVGYYFRSKTQ